jgi:hypothetical protein
MSKHRVGVVGLGMALKPHLQSLEELGDRVEIAACFTPSAERRKAFAAGSKHHVVDDLAPILSDRSIDVVFVLTPPMAHLELVERCAAAGKHVLIQKPIDVERGPAAVGAMDKAGRKFAIMLQHRFRAASTARQGRAGRRAWSPFRPLDRWWRTPDTSRARQRLATAWRAITQAIHTSTCSDPGGPIKVAAFARPRRCVRSTPRTSSPGPARFPISRTAGACTTRGGVEKRRRSDGVRNDAHKALIVDFLDAIDANASRPPAARDFRVPADQAMLRSAAEGRRRGSTA